MPDKRLSELPSSLPGATTVGLYGYDTNGESVQVSPDKVAKDSDSLQTVATLAELYLLNPVDYTGIEKRVSGVGNFKSNGTNWVPQSMPYRQPLTATTVNMIGANLYTKSGELVVIPSAVVTLPNASRDWFVHYDHGNAQYQCLRRTGHTGATYLAKVTCSGGAAINVQDVVNPVLRDSGIAKTKARLRLSQKVRIAAIGDSLTQGAGTYGAGPGEQAWTRMLFSTTYAAAGFNITGVANLVSHNYGVPSQTPHFGLVALGRNSRSGDNAFSGAAIHHLPEILSRHGPDAFNGSETKLRAGNYDCAIIGYANRRGIDDLAYLVAAIKRLREEGIEVIIQTANSGSGDDSLESDIDILTKVADAYGCELMDTWAYVDAVHESGVSPYADAIHMNGVGHNAWARAGYSIFEFPVVPQKAANVEGLSIYSGNNSGVLFPTYGGREARFSEDVHLQTIPFATTGTRATTAEGSQPLDQYKNPATQYGGLSHTGSHLELTVGQTADFAHGWSYAVDLMVKQGTAFGATIKDAGSGATITTISYDGSGSTYPTLIKIRNLGDEAGQLDNNQFGLGGTNRTYRVEVTSGTCNLWGMVFYVPKVRQIHPEDLHLKGTWTQETSLSGGIGAVGTDTVGDFMQWSGDASAVIVQIPIRSTTGTIENYKNGKLQSTLTYTAGNIYQTVIFTPDRTADDNIWKRKGRINIKIKLTVAGTAPSAGNRALMISSFAVVE